jgi:hypothetical protein
MFYFYKFAFESRLLLEIFIVKGTLIVDTHLHRARINDVELYLSHVAIIRVSRALKQTFSFVVTCTYCLS